MYKRFNFRNFNFASKYENVKIKNNLNGRLLIYSNDMTEEIADIDLFQLVTKMTVGSNKIGYTVVNGTNKRGILQGFGLLQAGATISFALRLFATRDEGVEDKIVYWKTLLNRSREYKYFLVRYYNGAWYSKELVPDDTMGYSTQLITNTNSINLVFKCVDNYYESDEVVKILGSDIKVGSNAIAYDSDTVLSAESNFEIYLENEVSTPVVISFYSKNGTGFSINSQVGANAILKWDGVNLTQEYDGISEALPYTGFSPSIKQGTNDLYISTTIEIKSFVLRYKPTVDL